jgi:hypothetical protein
MQATMFTDVASDTRRNAGQSAWGPSVVCSSIVEQHAR